MTAHELVPLVHRPGDPSVGTGLDKTLFLVYGSPKLRYILRTVDYYLPHSGNNQAQKILITEDVPLNAYYIELVLKSVYVEAEVLHAGLSDTERVDLVQRFRDPADKLMVLVIMYQVSAQGVNLDPCCSRVIVTTPAQNAPSEVQAWSRVIRVSQYLFHIGMGLGLNDHYLGLSSGGSPRNTAAHVEFA